MALPSISVRPAAYRQRRTTRRPTHSWHVRPKAFVLQPCMIAPVLPGETLRRFQMQSRVVTDPILSPLVGWHHEYWFFYVKITDLVDDGLGEAFKSLVIDEAATLASFDDATMAATYHKNGSETAVNWPLRCLKRVMACYFRSEGETWDEVTDSDTGLPIIGIKRNSFLDSAMDDADLVDANDVTLVDEAGSGTLLASELEAAMAQYELAKAMNLIDMTYEDFLESYGIKSPRAELHKPELLRYISDWQYPTNTVNPETGTPTSAVSWSATGRMDRPRLFKEPGFIFGCVSSRPKVYYKNLNSHATMLMKTAKTWLPAMLSDDPNSSLVKVTASDPPLDANTDDYWVDIKDLLLYGDQFVDIDLISGGTLASARSYVTLPLADLSTAGKQYPSEVDIEGLFVDTTSASGKTKIREDGICQLEISTYQRDSSPQHIGLTP